MLPLVIIAHKLSLTEAGKVTYDCVGKKNRRLKKFPWTHAGWNYDRRPNRRGKTNTGSVNLECTETVPFCWTATIWA